MGAVTRLIADLIVNSSEFISGMKSAESQLARSKLRMQKDLTDLGRNFKDTTNDFLGLKGALAGTLTASSLIFLSKQALETADGIQKLSEKLGLTTDQLQQYDYAAKLSGLSSEKFERGIANLNAQIAAGALPYKNTSEALLDISDRLANAKNGIERAGIVAGAFGQKMGKDFIPFLIEGRGRLIELGEEAKRFGVVLDQSTIKQSEKFKEQIEIIGQVISRNFDAGLLEGFVGQSDKLREVWTDPKFAQGVKEIGEALGSLMRFMVVNADKVVHVAEALGGAFIGARAGSVFGPTGAAVGALAGIGSVEAYRDSLKAAEIEQDNWIKKSKAMGFVTEATFANAPSRANSGATGNPAEQTKANNDRADTLKKINDELDKENNTIAAQIQNYGLKQNAMKEVIEAQKIEAILTENDIVLTQAQRAGIQAKLDLLYKHLDAYDKLNEKQKQANEIAHELGQTFSSAFEDMMLSGKSFREVLKGIIDDMLRLFLKMQAESFQKKIGDSFGGGGGGFGGILSALFGGGGGFNNFGQAGLPWQGFGSSNPAGGIYLGSFADGLDYVPRDGIAQVHAGERIMTANDNKNWGDGNSPTYVLNAPGADRGAVMELKALVMALAGPGRVEERVRDARKRGNL